MEFYLVLYERLKGGVTVVFTPYLENFLLYGTVVDAEHQFIWVHISGDVRIPEGVALRPGWRFAREEDQPRIDVGQWRLTYYPTDARLD